MVGNAPIRACLLAIACSLASGCEPYTGAETEMPIPPGPAGELTIATWNIENFPARLDTPERVAELITELGLDVVAVQEIADVAAFDRLTALLPGYSSVLSAHVYPSGNYQKLGLIYRDATVRADSVELLYENQSWPFPRPPLKAHLTVADGFDFVIVIVHLKAGRSANDQERRALAMEDLLDYGLTATVEVDPDLMIVGDFNTVPRGGDTSDLFAPFEADGAFELRTRQPSQAGDYSFVPSRVMLDHAITSRALAEEIQAPGAIPQLDLTHPSYESAISDHLPVLLSLDPTPEDR